MEQAIEHWRGLLRSLANALHSLLFVRGTWPALKATLVDFASKNNHAIVRSAMHLQLIKPLPPQPALVASGAAPNGSGGSKAGSSSKKVAAELPGWCPGQQMVCREFGVSAAAIPSPDAALFIEQACIAVRVKLDRWCGLDATCHAVCRVGFCSRIARRCYTPYSTALLCCLVHRATCFCRPPSKRRCKARCMRSASTAAGSGAACGGSWRIGRTSSTMASMQVGGKDGHFLMDGCVGRVAATTPQCGQA